MLIVYFGCCWFKIRDYKIIYLISGFLILGGYGTDGKSAEIFNPDLDHSCPVSELIKARHAHTLCNRMVCGGWFGWHDGMLDDTSLSCELFDLPTSTFQSLSVTLLQRRAHHLCWGLANGDVLLLGGIKWNGTILESQETTERVSADGSSSSAAFKLSSGIS